MHWRQDTFGTTRFGSVRFGLVWYSLCVLIVLVTATLTTSLRFAHFKHNANFEVHVLHSSIPPSVASLYNLNPLLADLLRLFPSPSLSLSLSLEFFACTSCVLCFGLHANCSQKSCLLCAHQTFSVGKRLSIQIECNTFWLNCMRVGLSAKSLDFHRLKLAFRATVECVGHRERVALVYVK